VAYAHSGPNPDPRTWQPLEEHLRAVAEMAREFAAPWGAGDLACLAGLWHDLGKYAPEFQEMLLEVQRGERKRRVDHSTAGAIHAESFLGRVIPAGHPLDFVHLLLTATIGGHHAGLADGRDALKARLEDRRALYERLKQHVLPGDLLRPRFPPVPSRIANSSGRETRLRCEFLVRMVFSALIDADRLDTAEAWVSKVPDGIRPSALRASYAPIRALRETIDRAIDGMVTRLGVSRMEPLEASVFRYRQEVLAACRSAADGPPGAFTLEVSTGGGKTLASLSFALRHAECHGKQRVIVVIPYTSIIEQTADVYRNALGDELALNLIEHHSAIEEDDGEGEQDPASLRRRLATENWDAPLIVTTGVQFFESLFARSASRCRKLHNIGNSVVILDEAQTLPPELLNPTVWAINELVEGYGVSAVLSTATQPSLEKPFPEVRNLRPIVREGIRRPLDRVRFEIVGEEPIAWRDLAAELAKPANSRVLCITHRRADARDLTLALDEMLGTEGTIHLSGTMCPAHRAERIWEVKQLLQAGGPCRVVSTQLVEAGVDIDFPMVYRALGGIDSLVQAAGRANREGRLGVRGGLLRVYRAPTQPPVGLPRKGAEVADAMLRAAAMDAQHLDLFELSVGRRFFRAYYESIGDKDRGITPMREEFRFGDVDRTYRFIEDAGATVVVPYGEAGALIGEARCAPFPARALRRLQRFGVTVYPAQVRDLLAAGAVEPLFPDQDVGSCSLFVLARSVLYSDRFGLDLSTLGHLTPDEFIR
jgi:CRISPR-associated endonuclease/helicase Cas3